MIRLAHEKQFRIFLNKLQITGQLPPVPAAAGFCLRPYFPTGCESGTALLKTAPTVFRIHAAK
jgi:hypothetical protein